MSDDPMGRGLVLQRNLGEEIVIAGVIRLKVVAANRFGCKLKIVAPRDVTIHRREVADAIAKLQIRLDGGGNPA